MEILQVDPGLIEKTDNILIELEMILVKIFDLKYR